MERASLLVLWLYFLIVHSPICIRSNDEVAALGALKVSLSDTKGVLDNWDPGLVDPCSWHHISCDTTSRVTRVNLGASELAGPLVSNLGDLEKLQYLELYDNKINGTIPKELGNLTSLISLDLYNNSLTGTIPKELANLKKLQYLRLNDNNLSGPLPKELADILPNIHVVNLTGNPLLECPCANCRC